MCRSRLSRRLVFRLPTALAAIALAWSAAASVAVAAPAALAETERAFAYEPASGPEISPSAAAEVGLSHARAIGTVEGEPAVNAGTLEAAQAAMQGAPQPLAVRAAAPPGLDAWLASAVDRVVLYGRFTDVLAKVPPGQPLPSGTVLEYAIDAHTGRVDGIHLGGAQPVAAAAARAARANRTQPARSRRVRAHAATWGSACSAGNGHHCYALDYWSMTGGEQVRGSESDIATDAMNVPEWQTGAFVDNEKWTVFPQKSNGNGFYWVEDGQEAGNYIDCCSLRWFTAWNNGAGYGANESPWPEPGFTFVRYQTVSQLNGTWCFYVEAGSAGCVGGFPSYAKELQVGAEYASGHEPENTMYEQSNGTWTDGSVHPWIKAEPFQDAKTCVAPFSRESPPHYYPGNIAAWTC
jgi:hypothetical protein